MDVFTGPQVVLWIHRSISGVNVKAEIGEIFIQNQKQEAHAYILG